MEATVASTIKSIELGESQIFENMTVVPLLSTVDDGPTYLTMGEAMEKRVLTIKEVSAGGSVPELVAVNSADSHVLLLDGEEVSGAKQNRVVNTTILLKEHSETVIPVSCTEQGRWRDVSDRFEDSDVVMASRMRSQKARSVNTSLRRSESYRSDQSEIWSSVREMSAAAGVHSPTDSMNDVFTRRSHDLSEYLEAFNCLASQRGILVFINGSLIGFDFLSFRAAYEKLHSKLLKSYAMDALISEKARSQSVNIDTARTFLQQTTTAAEKVYDSIGHGKDHRYEGNTLVGSALVYLESVIHMAFFRNDGAQSVGGMSISSRRTAHRTF